MNKEQAEKAATIAKSLFDQALAIAEAIQEEVFEHKIEEPERLQPEILSTGILFTWTEYHHGEDDYYDVSIPFSYFESDFIAIEKAKRVEERRVAELNLAQRQAEERKKHEEGERKILANLKAKYE